MRSPSAHQRPSAQLPSAKRQRLRRPGKYCSAPKGCAAEGEVQRAALGQRSKAVGRERPPAPRPGRRRARRGASVMQAAAAACEWRAKRLGEARGPVLTPAAIGGKDDGSVRGSQGAGARRHRPARGRGPAAGRASTSRAVTVEPPRDPAHGDMATNAAMVLARPARHGAARHRRGAGRDAGRRPGHRLGRGGGAGVPEPAARARALVRGDPAGAGGGDRTSAARTSAPGGG